MDIMIPMAVCGGLCSAAGYITGRATGDKRGAAALSFATGIMIQSTSAIANGAIDVLKQHANMDSTTAIKALMAAAGAHGFAGVVLDKTSGEMINGNNKAK